MNLMVRPATLVAAALLVAAGSYALVTMAPQAIPPRSAAGPTPASVGLPDSPGPDASLERIDAAIAVWSGNLERDGADFIAATNLGQLYLERARLTGLATDYDRSLRAVDRGLAANPHLAAGRALRAQVLFASHDFAAAEAAATKLLRDHPGLPQALATLGDARLERGDYGGAESAYRELAEQVESAAVTARLARLAAVTGSLDEARALADEALAAAADAAVSPVDRAWYQVLVGALAFQDGDIPAAVGAYEAALKAWPASPQAAAGLGRALAAQGRLPDAIRMYERAVAAAPQPESLAALGDLLALAGRDDDARVRYEQVRGIAAIEAEAGLYNRALVLFYANHGESTDRAVRMAAVELEDRPDAYGWDAYAWALYAAERFAEAEEAMAKALSFGTQDTLFDYHAGMIAAANGRADDAARLLRAALDRNSGFDPFQAERARRTLASLEAGS
jgi:tetratricopeptide (TPR) repeat protein